MTSSGTTGAIARVCSWCRAPIPEDARKDAVFDTRACRQAAFRLRRRRETSLTDASTRARFAYADPPYPGTAKKYYGREKSYGGEVDHRALISELECDRLDGDLDGWALSTSAKALREILPLCPPAVRVCAWVKPGGVPVATFGLHNTWEPLLVVGGRQIRPGKRDSLLAQPARGGGTLMGRKPLAFCAFLFDSLGMLPGDELHDIFPGTGIVSRAWAEIGRSGARAPDDASPPAIATGVSRSTDDASPLEPVTPGGSDW